MMQLHAARTTYSVTVGPLNRMPKSKSFPISIFIMTIFLSLPGSSVDSFLNCLKINLDICVKPS